MGIGLILVSGLGDNRLLILAKLQLSPLICSVGVSIGLSVV